MRALLRCSSTSSMVGRPKKEHGKDIVLLAVIAAVIAYAVWKIVAG